MPSGVVRPHRPEAVVLRCQMQERSGPGEIERQGEDEGGDGDGSGRMSIRQMNYRVRRWLFLVAFVAMCGTTARHLYHGHFGHAIFSGSMGAWCAYRCLYCFFQNRRTEVSYSDKDGQRID
jgi:hypothetical protein